jgi:4-hydroxythreonine-4-phosphate dehydrogenase
MATAGTRPTLAVTVGEPAGIGPEISIRAAWALREQARCVLVGDAAFLSLTASLIDPAIRLSAISTMALRHSGLPHFGPGVIPVVDVPLEAHVVPGQLDADNGRAVLATLDLAIEGAVAGGAGWFDAIVTAPLQKSTINDAGIAFSGHTEYLADKTGTPKVVMMLAGSPGEGQPWLRVALATTHLPLKDVPGAITRDSLAQVLDILHADLRANGYLGREEIEVIGPVLEAARARGIDARGPYPADTLFQPKYLQDADAVLAMYHDQGLPVLKYATFGRGVNITLGLPLIRTSVDHGTALDLAGQGLGLADCGSMEEAIRVALSMVHAQQV